MPTLRSLLNEIQAELDSRQIVVNFRTTHEGVKIEAEDYPSMLIARRELRRQGIEPAENIPCTVAQNLRSNGRTERIPRTE